MGQGTGDSEKKEQAVVCSFGRCLHNREGKCSCREVKIGWTRTDDEFYDLFPFCQTAVVVDA